MHTWKSRLYLIFVVFTTLTLSGVFFPPVFANPPHLPQAEHLPKVSPEIPLQEGIMLRTGPQGIPIPAPLVETTVNITITGLIARTTVVQQFYNPSEEWAEGIYVFPLPDQAAVDHMRMKVGERIIEGQIQEREQAKKTYDKAKAAGKQASLVEQERPNMFTTSVANIAPHTPITVEIEYQEMAAFDQGRFALRFPMVVGPRYIPGQPIVELPPQVNNPGGGWSPNTDQVPDASRITPPVLHPSNGPLNPLTLSIDLAPGMQLKEIYSPTHPITVEKDAQGHHHITLQQAQTFADRDFELQWTPLSTTHPQTAVFSERLGEDTYLYFQVMPPLIQLPSMNTIPREVIFVIDTSGSMAGASLTQAKAALTLALSRLTPRDAFNVIQFNSETRSLFWQSKPASNTHIHQAQRYVQNLQAQGGTEMQPAIRQALTPHTHTEDSPQLRQVIFITDGLVGNEAALFHTVKDHLGRSRLFTVGIGSAPNGHFMRKATQFGKGTFTYIGTTQEVKEKMNRLFQKLEHPALTDIQIYPSDSTLGDRIPNPLPDLYVGEPLTMVMRTSHPPSVITFSGNHGAEAWKITQSLKTRTQRKGIAVHWARQKISQLMDRQTGPEGKDALRQQILDLALRHHIVSKYTSLVAVDVTPVRALKDALHTHALKTNLPQEMKYEAIFGWPRTATPSRIYLLGGILLLWLSWLSSRQRLVRP